MTSTRGHGGSEFARLWVVRHGQSSANLAFEVAAASGRVDSGVDGRDADVPLSDLGRVQAQQLGRALIEILGTTGGAISVFSSPFLRARETVQIALAVFETGAGVPAPMISVDERLRDQDMGILELLTPAAIEQRHSGEAQRRQRVGDLYYRPPGGESLVDVGLRVRSFMRDLDTDPSERVLVVAHDAIVLVTAAILGRLTEPEIIDRMTSDPARNGSVSHWQRVGSRWQLHYYNNITHLDRAEIGKIASTQTMSSRGRRSPC